LRKNTIIIQSIEYVLTRLTFRLGIIDININKDLFSSKTSNHFSIILLFGLKFFLKIFEKDFVIWFRFLIEATKYSYWT